MPNPQQLKTIQSLPLYQFSLKNGLRVIIHPEHSAPVFTMRLVYGVGSRDEKKGQSGYAHLVEHLMFKGSVSIRDGDYMASIQSSGGRSNASTDYDRTDFWVQLPKSMLSRALWMEADRMRNLHLNKDKVDNQRQAVVEEKALRLTNQPYLYSVAKFIIQQWQNTPYGHLLIGSDEDLQSANTDKMNQWLQQYYHPANVVLALSGDLDIQETERLIKKYFADLPSGQNNPEIKDQALPQISIHQRLVDAMAPWPVHAIAWNTPGFAAKNSLAIRILNDVLFSNPDGIITRKLVEETKLALAVQHLDYGFQYISLANAIIIPHSYASSNRIEKIIQKSLNNLHQKGIPEQEICASVSEHFYQKISQYQNPLALITVLSDDLLVHNDVFYTQKQLTSMLKLTPEKLQPILKQYFSNKYFFVTIEPSWWTRFLKTLSEWLPDSFGNYLEQKIL